MKFLLKMYLLTIIFMKCIYKNAFIKNIKKYINIYIYIEIEEATSHVFLPTLFYSHYV